MGKERKGWIVEREGKLYVRIQFTDNLGKSRELMRRANDRKHARQLQKELVKQLDSAEENPRAEMDAQKLTFAKVAAAYEEARLVEAQYVGDPPRKVAGLRSLRTPKAYLKRLVEHFGSARIRSITYSQIDAYRLKRLSEGLSIAATNRQLALLRSVFNFAKREGILTRTPFETGAPLISVCDETKRDRVLGREEEEKLLLALSDERRLHIRALVVAALDSGARKNELLTLRWSDVDLEGGGITIRALNSKTAKSRQIPISARLKDELQRIRDASDDDSDVLVFNSRNFKRCWYAALKDAGITDFHFHDARSTFCTRLIERGMPIEQVAKLSGHTELETLYKHYLSTTPKTLQKATELLNSFNAGELNETEEASSTPDYIN